MQIFFGGGGTNTHIRERERGSNINANIVFRIFSIILNWLM